MSANTYGRQVVLPLTNKSGGGVVAGDVVVVDTANNDAFTTTTSAGFTGGVGIAQETIASNAVGRVLLSGYAALVNVNASVTRGNFGKTHTVAKQATDAGASRGAGTFCQFLTGGTTPDALVYPVDLLGSSLTNPMTTTGDIIYASDNSGTPARLAATTSGYLLTAQGAGTAPHWAAAPAGGITHTTLGTSSPGASDKSLTRGLFVKKITLSADGVLSAIWVYVKGDGSHPAGPTPVIYADSAGSPTNLIYAGWPVITSAPQRVFPAIMNTTYRWVVMPVGAYLTAADYWIGFWNSTSDTGYMSIKYTASSGSDKTQSTGAEQNEPVDSSIQAFSSTTDDYAIYADILR